MKRWPAYRIYLASTGAAALGFTLWSFISGIYRVQDAALNPLQLVLLGTALEIAVFLFEVPTGVVADVVSRRLSVIIGYSIMGLGFLLEAATRLFWPILLAQATWGIGWTFISGARDAWLADELGEARLARVYLRGSQVGTALTLLGILASVRLGLVSHRLPMLLGGAIMLALALFLALFMPETGFRPTPRPDRNTWQKMSDTFVQGAGQVRRRPLLLTIMGITLFLGLSSEGIDRLQEAHFLRNLRFPAAGDLDPVIWFGIINVITLLLSLGAIEIMRRRAALEGARASLALQIIFLLLAIASVIVFGLAGQFGLAMASIIIYRLLRQAHGPLFGAWVNKQIDPEVRATVLSMQGQMDAVGQIAGGPFMGLIGNSWSIRAALVGVGVVLTPALPLYGLARRLTGRLPVTESLPTGSLPTGSPDERPLPAERDPAPSD